jgi:hypothetical protein
MKMKNTKKTHLSVVKEKKPRKAQTKPEKAIDLILTACEFFNWHVIVPKTAQEEDPIPYLLIGEREYLNQVVKHLEKTNFELQPITPPIAPAS